jgi:hypothetical protein
MWHICHNSKNALGSRKREELCIARRDYEQARQRRYRMRLHLRDRQTNNAIPRASEWQDRRSSK